MNKTPLSALGGIVWKHQSGQKKIAIMRDLNGERGWYLPVLKKPNGAEQNQSVRLEMFGKLVGTEVEQLQKADTLFYPEWNPPGCVVYWHLRVKANAKKFQNSADNEVLWLPVNKASEMLSHESEKRLINLSEYPETDLVEAANSAPEMDFDNFNSKNNPTYEYLNGELLAHNAELETTIQMNLLEDGTIPYWGKQAKKLIKIAGKQMRQNKLHAAWKSLSASKRLTLYSLDKDEIPKIAMRIRLEAEKLTEWRKDAVHQLLGKKDETGKIIDRTSLILAAQIRDEHFNDYYYKTNLARVVNSTLLILLTTTVAFIFAYFAYLSHVPGPPLISFSGNERIISELPLLTGIFLFGLFGGGISSLFRINADSVSIRLAEFINNYLFTTVRVFTGGAAALVLFIFLESEFAIIPFQDLTLRPTSYYTYFFLAFICGFTERLLLRAVTALRK